MQENRESIQASAGSPDVACVGAGESSFPAKGGKGKRRAQSPSRSDPVQERWEKRRCLNCGEDSHGYSGCPHSLPVIPQRFAQRKSARSLPWVGKGKARETP
ncbi:hypothetical protein WJX75_006830 [Coccomyxa subellipsoidea]|uniref:CCHC-type domain-containing protein n=1 Tax=Coccomyxa subellipsoidea TaxID=248742 RepID=A0ABR2Z4B7_9CHLO